MGSCKSFIKLEANKCTNVVKMEVLLQCNRVGFFLFVFFQDSSSEAAVFLLHAYRMSGLQTVARLEEIIPCGCDRI